MSYDGDVAYEVWRAGGNPDRVHPDYCSHMQAQGVSAEECASGLLRHWREQREQRQIEEQEALEAERQYYEEQQQEHENGQEESAPDEPQPPTEDGAAPSDSDAQGEGTP